MSVTTVEIIEYRGFNITTNSLQIDWYWYSDDAPEPSGFAWCADAARKQIDEVYEAWKEDPQRWAPA